MHGQEDFQQSSLKEAALPERQDMQLPQPAPIQGGAAKSQGIAGESQIVQDCGEWPNGAENRRLIDEQPSKTAQKDQQGASEILQSDPEQIEQQPDGRNALQHAEVPPHAAAEDAERDISISEAVRHAPPAEAGLCNGIHDPHAGATHALPNGFLSISQNGFFGPQVAFFPDPALLRVC